jgi:hypothetical protein
MKNTKKNENTSTVVRDRYILTGNFNKQRINIMFKTALPDIPATGISGQIQ